jgi:two-component system, OmpR family, sensor histidine kinase CpxA
MRSTFIKIFLSFWISEILIAVCAIVISVREYQSTAIAYTSSFATMQTMSRLSITAYKSGGCAAMNAVPSKFYLDGEGALTDRSLLFDPDGKPMCEQLHDDLIDSALTRLRKDGYLLGERHGANYIQGISIKGDDGRTYYYLQRGRYPGKVYIPYREVLLRLLIGLIVSVLVTFAIAKAITRPIGRLRGAAKELAAGNLSARAVWPKANRESGDELRGLIHDFNVMAERLESLVDSHKLLLRDVSHELRSPLARLSVALEWAREEAQPGIENQLERMESETIRLNALIGQLLSLSHLESTIALPSKQPFSVADVVEGLLPDADYEAKGRNCQVNFVNASSNESVVLGNPELLGRAIENLIRNAIAYTAEGTSIDIHLSQEADTGRNMVVLQVKDHGPGVPETALKSIFHPFYRLDNSRQRSTGGFGVGLAITERAVQLHGGEVIASNAAEGGLVVELRLPSSNRSAY